jgi:nicotinate dehydrogenase subunit B
MVQPAVAQRPPETKLPFPYGVRPLLAGWNLAFHDPAAFQPDPARSAQWNRGAYLVNGIGHCGACHTPRNALGAERSGSAFLAGGEAEGWRAPALGARSTAPVPWTEQELFTYLRFGTSPQHGPAGGPMRAVVQGVSELAESDARAIAHYLANQPGTGSAPDEAAARAAVQGLQQRSEAVSARLQGPGARLYEGACAVCHEPGLGGLQPEAKLPLALNSNVHDDLPDNLIQVLLNGIEPAQGTLGGSMPAYAETFDDRQIEELAHYLRARFAPGRPAWKGVDADIARVRGLQSRHASRSEN